MLNNFKYWLSTFALDTNIVAGTSSTGNYATTTDINGVKHYIKDIDGKNVTGYYDALSNYLNKLGHIETPSAKGVRILLGKGSSEKTTDETYKLEEDVTSSFALGVVTSAVNYLDGKVQLVLTAQYTNSSASSMQINEIGLALLNKRRVSGNSYTDVILLDRKSNADDNFNSVTLGVGESKIFVYAIEL